MVATDSDLNGQFAEIHELRNRANKEVDLANAYEQLNSDPNADLAKKYENRGSALEERLSKLMTTNTSEGIE